MAKKKDWQNVIDNLTQDIQKRNKKKKDNEKRSQSKVWAEQAKPIEKSTKLIGQKLRQEFNSIIATIKEDQKLGTINK